MLFPIINIVYFYIVLPQVCVQCPIWLFFCSSLISCFPRMLLRCFLNDFEMESLAPLLTGITFVFTFHMPWIPIIRSLYFRIFSSSFLITFLSPEIPTSSNIHVSFSLSLFTMSGLWLGMVLSVCTSWFHLVIHHLHELFRLILVHGQTVGT